MKTLRFRYQFHALRLIVCLLATVTLLLSGHCAGAAVIVNVVETGGDNEATDTVPAKWTGVTFVGGIANEPVPGLAAGASYTVLTFSNHSPSYVDRNHRWTNASATVLIPPYLIGGDYIMIGNDNRDNAGLRLDVTVNGQVRCYLLIDNRLGGDAANPPTFSPTLMSWVTNENWTPVITGVNRANNPAFPDEIGVDESADASINNWSSIYSKDFPAGTFQLKQPDNAGQNMYGAVVVSIGPTTPPSAPTNLVAVSENAQVTLSWSNAPTATGYNVKRASSSGGPYTTIATVAGNSFTDSPLANSVDYFYVVSGTNVLGEGPNSLEVVGHPNAIVTGITAVGGTNQVILNWSALGGATSYSVLRSGTSNGTYVVIASGIAGTTHTDTTAPSGSTLFYRISADLGASGPSGQSASVPAVTAPGAPVVTASLFASTVIRVAWTSDPVISGFNLEQSLDGVSFSPLAALAGTQKSYTNTGLAPSTTYFYRVQASNETGLSGYSAIASNRTPAIGYNINFQLGTAPIPPGYMKDIGDLYGDRTNGFFYGWTNVGNTNITVDARQRNNPASPDLRYDTFNHLMKAAVNDPNLSATWELEIPNGFYSVRIVAGDPDNGDPAADRFQFDVEGVLTADHIPTLNPFSNRFAEFNVSMGVSDGRLRIGSGPLARNNKIAFVDIYPAIPVAPAITAQPQSVTIEENRPVALSPTVTGSSVLMYQWYFNDSPVLDATNRILSFARPQTANAGNYYVVVTNYGGAATSSVATLTVTEDTIAPRIVSVGSLDGVNVGISFSEEIDITSGAAAEFGNYQINGGSVPVDAITFRPDGKSVKLHLATPISGAFTLDTLDIPDYAGNSTISSTNAQALPFVAQDVGAPAMAGRNYTSDNQTFEIVGGGADIWGTADQGYLALTPVSGDFDARVQVTDLRGSNTITKAVLTARESIAADSAAITVGLNPPPPGRDQTETGLRPTTTAATVGVGPSFIPAGVPNAWMRIRRAGNLFTTFRSANGTDWIQLGQTNLAFPADLQVGFGVTAHDNTLLATGTFSGFTTTAPPPSQPPITNFGFSGGTFGGAIQTQNGVTYTVQYKDDLNAPSWSTLTTIIGDGTVKTFSDPAPPPSKRFYRIVTP